MSGILQSEWSVCKDSAPLLFPLYLIYIIIIILNGDAVWSAFDNLRICADFLFILINFVLCIVTIADLGRYFNAISDSDFELRNTHIHTHIHALYWHRAPSTDYARSKSATYTSCAPNTAPRDQNDVNERCRLFDRPHRNAITFAGDFTFRLSHRLSAGIMTHLHYTIV